MRNIKFNNFQFVIYQIYLNKILTKFTRQKLANILSAPPSAPPPLHHNPQPPLPTHTHTHTNTHTHTHTHSLWLFVSPLCSLHTHTHTHIHTYNTHTHRAIQHTR